ncbi:MAG: hypothetical protein EBU34_11870 [Alphaproteobacteria bacterium]|nr:hypothetical protein [Alphaproteobacteria bacterium]
MRQALNSAPDLPNFAPDMTHLMPVALRGCIAFGFPAPHTIREDGEAVVVSHLAEADCKNHGSSNPQSHSDQLVRNYIALRPPYRAS